jgi:hypothetical protein
MFAIRGIYDGKQVKVLPSEPLPRVNHEVTVAIVFWEDLNTDQSSRAQREVARRMRAAREAMPPLKMSVKDLVEAGRER